MLAFAEAILERMRRLDPEIAMVPKDALFRIHRDTRFSKDKTPYKTHAGLAVSRGGKTDHSTPGIYVHLDARSLGVASGCYFLDRDQLVSIRRAVTADADHFAALLTEEPFRKLFGTIVGDRSKRLPPEFREAAASQPLLYNKRFYYWAEYPAEEALRSDLPEFVMRHYEAAMPMNAFLAEALRKGTRA